MYPYLFNNQRLPSYGIMIFIGIAVCAFIIIFLDKQKKIKTEDKIYCTAIGVVGGLLGAKILSLVTSIKYIVENKISFMDAIKSGFVFYGGLIGGLVAITIYCKAYKIKLFDFYDLAAWVLPVGQAFGRIGCFLAGCCYGKVTDSPLGVIFTNPIDPTTPLGVKILPTQLFEAAYCLLIFAVLSILRRKKFKCGTITAAYMLMYSVCRFINEFFRADDARGFLFNMSTSQIISILLFIAGLGIIWFLYLKKPKASGQKTDA